MTAAVLALLDGVDPRPAEGGVGLALKLSKERGQPAHLLSLGEQVPPDFGWTCAFQVGTRDGRAAASAAADLLARNEYAAVAASDGPLAREVLGRLAGRLKLPLVARVLSARADGEAIEVLRSVDGGKRSAKYRIPAPPALLIADPDASFAVNAPARGPAAVEALAFQSDGRVRLTYERTLDPSEVELTEAEVVVAGGRGMAGPEGFGVLEELAGLLQGAVGASRVAVDLGWAPKAAQVGMTGKTVSPRLYVACGISGAVHHTFGMKDSGLIVAINIDPGAALMRMADVSVVGDAKEVLRELISVLRSRSARTEPRPQALAGTGV